MGYFKAKHHTVCIFGIICTYKSIYFNKSCNGFIPIDVVRYLHAVENNNQRHFFKTYKSWIHMDCYCYQFIDGYVVYSYVHGLFTVNFT